MESKPYLREVQLMRDGVSSFDKYPFNIAAIKSLSSLHFHPDVTFIVGENGSGKSTLIEAIALGLGFSIEGGPKSVQATTHDNASGLFEYLKLVRSYKLPKDYFFLRAESFYNVATYMEELKDPNYLKGYGGSLHGRSHGEAFLAVLTKKLKGGGLYIFDEPEAALSASRQMTALVAIDELVQKQSQLIIATHSPILLAYPHAVIYQLDENGITKMAYEDTAQYQVTKGFLDDYKRMLSILLDRPQ
ncbi:AAA family ATPase [Dyadobacter chenwenxiniae]|uniref:AAA family ATPase n=1 Tax=Dyadobacter chenwenxiniae TaxID=2906456 RepID=A0A9X1TH22_9BACT|nr:AAA family ATPase [Dyadobacter chenwenxiniae]MCF0064677.1 AAA family ATPase [Dyadobacter chenwenxiniae]UON84269.1 AAA family ATPase [Dyadobacter chenwenxiniae]